MTIMVLRLLNSDPEKITEQLAQKFIQAPALFQNAPVVIDLHTIQADDTIDLPFVVNLLREQGLMPVGIRGGSLKYNQIATHLNLGILPDAKKVKAERSRSEPTVTAPPSVNTKIVTQPIRSGQQVVFLEGDLIVLATVSPGAEILAQRHIHVYGALRGRALAGVNGDDQARIFCQHLDAELVSIAGQYQINEDLADNLRGKPVQIYVENDILKIQALEPYYSR